MKNILLAALAALLLPAALFAAAPQGRNFEGYSKYVKMHVHFDVNADATYTESVEYALKLLDKQGVDGVNTQSVSYSNSLSDMKVVAAYTVKKNGKRIDVSKDNFQVETNSGENGASPLISDIKTKTVVFPDVDVGDTIVFSYKLIQKEALFPRQFTYAHVFSNEYICEDCELSLSAPASLPVRVEARDVKGGEEAKKNGKRQWTWHFENREIAKPEQLSVSSFDYAPRVMISTFKDYAELAAAYEQRAKPKAAVTPEIKALAADLTKDAKTDRKAAKALYDWVAKNIAYAGNCIGIGSVVPHGTDHILSNKIGDCKDHTALLQALLAAKGIESTPVLVNSGSVYSLPELPMVSVFNHVINYIPSFNLYADSTSEVIPFGMLPPAEEGKPVIHTAKFTGIQHTPPSDNAANKGLSHVEITFNEDGSADGVVKTSVSGMQGLEAKEFFERLDMTRYKEMVLQASLSAHGYKGTGEYVHYDDPKADGDKFTYEVKFHAEDAINLPGPGAMYVTPLIAHHTVSVGRFLTAVNVERPLHSFPCSGGSATEEIIFHLPASAQLMAVPKDLHLKIKDASYDSTYKQEGNSVVTSRSIVDNTPGNVCAPEVYDEFKPFYARITKDLKAQVIYK